MKIVRDCEKQKTQTDAQTEKNTASLLGKVSQTQRDRHTETETERDKEQSHKLLYRHIDCSGGCTMRKKSMKLTY